MHLDSDQMLKVVFQFGTLQRKLNSSSSSKNFGSLQYRDIFNYDFKCDVN